MGNAGAEGSEPELDASISKESKWDEEHRTKSNRKRPPDHGGSGASPIKRNRPNADNSDDDDAASNMSSIADNDHMSSSNVKREPDDDGDLVFVKQELSSNEYDPHSNTAANVSHSQSFDMSHLQGQQPGFSTPGHHPQDFDGSHDGSGSGSAWAQQRNTSLDASSMAMTTQSTSQGGSQQVGFKTVFDIF